jgi:hypothetical protein
LESLLAEQRPDWRIESGSTPDRVYQSRMNPAEVGLCTPQTVYADYASLQLLFKKSFVTVGFFMRNSWAAPAPA